MDSNEVKELVEKQVRLKSCRDIVTSNEAHFNHVTGVYREDAARAGREEGEVGAGRTVATTSPRPGTCCA